LILLRICRHSQTADRDATTESAKAIQMNVALAINGRGLPNPNSQRLVEELLRLWLGSLVNGLVLYGTAPGRQNLVQIR
jgi:hypothetical protein